MEENRNEIIELLNDIKSANKKKLFYSRITAALFLVMVIFLGVTVPVVVNTLNIAQEALVNANTAVEQAKGVMSELSGTIDDMDAAIKSIDTFVTESSDTMVQAFENVNSIDFEGLNQAIEDLGNVVEPLSRFFGKFK